MRMCGPKDFSEIEKDEEDLCAMATVKLNAIFVILCGK